MRSLASTFTSFFRLFLLLTSSGDDPTNNATPRDGGAIVDPWG
jgi:hypothetical protein